MAEKRDTTVAAAGDGALRVPVLEERLLVEKRLRQVGEALFRRRVTAERQSAAVDLAREQLRVERRALAPRPASPEELEGAFTERTMRIPVFGETAVTRKAPFITGEVVAHRRRATEKHLVTEALRRERVDVDGVETPSTEAPAAVCPATAQPAALDDDSSGPPPIRKLLDDVRAGWERARRAA